MDLIDLADPIRLLILLLPERYRGPAAALITALVAAQGIAASIVSRLPLAAAQDPRWGRVVRALHWYSLLRFRDEKGTTKAIGAELAPRVTVAPVPSGLAHPAQIFAPQIVPPVPTPAEGVDPVDEDAHASIVPPAPFDPHRTMRGATSLSAAIVAVALLGIVAAVGAMVMGCPRVPPVSGCQPEAQTCINDRPSVCSASQRWHVAGDRSCASVGGVCTVLGGRAYCGPVVDAGADVGDAE